MKDSLLSVFLTSFFQSLDASAIPFCVLRNYDTLPEYTANDVDILVYKNDFVKAVHLLYRIAGRIGLILHLQIEHACLVLMFHSQENSHDQYHIDLYSDITWKGFSIADPDSILKSRRCHMGFYIPDPAWEQAVNLLVSLIYHGRVKEPYKRMIHKTAVHQIHGATLLTILNQSFGPHEGRLLWEYAKNSAWKPMENRYRKVQNALIIGNLVKDPSGLIRRQAAMVRRLIKRVFHPAGISIAIIGPDGAGKSSVIKGLGRALSTTFKDKQAVVHWRPELKRPPPGAKQTPETNPHGKPVRNKALSLIFFTYHTLMFILGHTVKLAPLRFRGWAIFLDRYYYDFFVDLKRFRLNLSRQWVGLGFFFIPKPEIVLLLDAPPGVIRQRKNEVSKDETDRQCLAYQRLSHRLPNSYILNADQPVDHVVDDALEIIMGVLSQKAENQYRKKKWLKH